MQALIHDINCPKKQHWIVNLVLQNTSGNILVVKHILKYSKKLVNLLYRNIIYQCPLSWLLLSSKKKIVDLLMSSQHYILPNKIRLIFSISSLPSTINTSELISIQTHQTRTCITVTRSASSLLSTQASSSLQRKICQNDISTRSSKAH